MPLNVFIFNIALQRAWTDEIGPNCLKLLGVIQGNVCLNFDKETLINCPC